MLMKLLLNVFERARAKLIVRDANHHCSSDSDIEVANIDTKPVKCSITQQQPRSSLSKWLCTIPTTMDKPISNRVRRSSSWRSLRERGNSSINSRTYSVDELHRNPKQFHRLRRKDVSHSHRKLPHDPPTHTRFDRLSSTLIDYSNPKKTSPRRKHQQPIFSTLSRHSNGGDSGYSEDSFATRSCQRPLHTSCPHCHCEQRSSFNHYKKCSKTISSSGSSPLNTPKSYENLSAHRADPRIQPLQQKVTRTLAQKRRRNLSCDGSLWTRPQSQKAIIVSTSPVFSEPNRLPLQRHLTAIAATRRYPSNIYTKTLPTNPNIFGELNLAAIERDSLRTSFSSSSYSSSSSSSIHQESDSRKQVLLVWHEYQNASLLSKTNGTKTFSVRRGDQVHLLKRMGKSTLLVQKEEDGSIGFLPQTCLAPHQINSFLSLKGLRETVL